MILVHVLKIKIRVKQRNREVRDDEKIDKVFLTVEDWKHHLAYT